MQSLRACPSRNRLLILDVMQPVAKPSPEGLDNDIARHVCAYLEKELNKEAEPPLRVLCARAARFPKFRRQRAIPYSVTTSTRD